jgi:hypothetical protein
MTEPPTLPPPPSDEPTPTPTSYATPWHATPTPEVRNFSSFVELVNAYARFDEGGELKDQSGDFQINYSRALLDGAGIASISVDSPTMQSAHNKIVELIYKSIKESKGSRITLGGSRDTTLQAVVDKIHAYSVSPEEYANISFALENNNFKYQKLSYVMGSWLTYVDQQGAIQIISEPTTYGLSGIPENWDRKDVSYRAIIDGGSATFQNIDVAALMAKGDEFNTTPSDPVFEEFGLNKANDFGLNGELGKLTVGYNK